MQTSIAFSDLLSSAASELKSYHPPYALFENVSPLYKSYAENTDGINLYYSLLAVLVRLLQPRLTVELGANQGLSTIMLYSELPRDSRLISCDNDPAAWSFLPDRVRLDPRLDLIGKSSLDLEVHEPIDLLFVDTLHTYNQVSAEWARFSPHLSPGAYILFDDIDINDMPVFWNQLALEKANVGHLYHPWGFGIAQWKS